MHRVTASARWSQNAMNLHRLTLVLNRSYEAINVISARRAVTMVMKGIAMVELPSQYVVRTSMATFPIPSVIRLEGYRKLPRITRAVSRKTILLRDRYTCQYCQKPYLAKQLTLDHVIPRSRSGGNTWENLVACCYPCNNRKGSRTPVEAGMVLARKPAAIGFHAKHRLMAGDDFSEWDRYLYC